MAERIEGPVQLILHLESLQARQNPELFGKAEYRVRVWLNGLERWQSEQLVKVAEGAAVPLAAAISLRLEDETDVVSIQVGLEEKDLLSADDPAEGSFELYRSAGFFAGERFSIPVSGPDADLTLHCRVEANALAQD